MIKAVFFDWFNTLAHYDPPRYQLHSQACQELGIGVSPQQLLRGVLTGDKYFFEENVASPVEKRSSEEKARVYFHYQNMVLAEAGVKLEEALVYKIMGRVQQLFKEVTFVLFDDVLPAMEVLKGRQLVLGLLTNATRDMLSGYLKLGLEAYLDFVVTSQEVGGDKPQPPIFLAALERAGVGASEAIHVGDQYKIDVAGARGVGIKPVLLDRYDMYPDITDCPRISTLSKIVDFI